MYSLDTDARHAWAMEQRRSRWRSASGKRNARFTKTVMWKAVRHATSERPAARKGIHKIPATPSARRSAIRTRRAALLPLFMVVLGIRARTFEGLHQQRGRTSHPIS